MVLKVYSMNFVGDKLPAAVQRYKQTPMFTEQTLPSALTRMHSTKSGVWGIIHVVSGKLRYVVPSTCLDVELDARTRGVISPERSHHVELIGEVTFFIEFWK